jgi:hypothetical protein
MKREREESEPQYSGDLSKCICFRPHDILKHSGCGLEGHAILRGTATKQNSDFQSFHCSACLSAKYSSKHSPFSYISVAASTPTYRYAAVTAQAKLKREEQARQSSRQEIAHSIAEADVLTSELTNLLIEKVYVFLNNRIEIVYKVHDLFE